jgi:hypothetical protein
MVHQKKKGRKVPKNQSHENGDFAENQKGYYIA